MITRPMLAVNADLDNIRYPVMATPKLDGIRCLKVNGQCVTRTFKPIPNHHIRGLVEQYLPDGVDGELISGTFNESTSAVMTRDGTPDFQYMVFDYVHEGCITDNYEVRMTLLHNLFVELPDNVKLWAKMVRPLPIFNAEGLSEFEAKCLAEGYEGVMIRSQFGPYKCGRSTVKEGYLLKVKRFDDAEAIVIGFEELMHNGNELKKDMFGLADRQLLKENLVPMNTLGALVVKDVEMGIEFKIGTGFTEELRKEIWSNQDRYRGSLAKYKHQPSGRVDAPRFPVFIGFRDERDR